jgi:hypothetical protein
MTKSRPAAHRLAPAIRSDLLRTLEDRFAKHVARHADLRWAEVRERLEARADKLWSLHQMEITGGEPDVVGRDPRTGEYVLYDCSPQSPKGRRSLCYDAAALAARKENKPTGSAAGMAATMGIELLTEEQYRHLQQLGPFDTTTSSWVETPAEVRRRGGALFCDRRYDHVFLYHNGAESYYAARGFRGVLKI